MDEFDKYKIETRKFENKSKLERYLSQEDDIKNEVNFDILFWWKLNNHRFPILSHLGHDVLVVSISTIASESTFDTGGHILDVYRSFLTPKLVQALIYAQYWLHGSLKFNPNAFEDEVKQLDQIDLGNYLTYAIVSFFLVIILLRLFISI
ncbi:hypothetical protein REPUB_Repub02eG0169200 [Reevesia pubescens]